MYTLFSKAILTLPIKARIIISKIYTYTIQRLRDYSAMNAPLPANEIPDANNLSIKKLKVILFFLLSGFVLSQAYRTLGGILSVPLREEFSLDNHTLASIVGSFHIAFGGLQLLAGIFVDCFGIRKTILALSPFTILGTLLSATATSPDMLLAGQIMLGFGCAPAFLVCMVLIAKHFPAKDFAPMYAIALGTGSLGLIFTSTPTAWISEVYGWRTCFYILAVASTLSWLLIYFGVRDIDQHIEQSRTSLKEKFLMVLKAISGYKELLKIPATPAILSLLFVNYAAFITLRGLWLGPLLVERHQENLVFAGNLALVLSIVSLFSPSIFGRLDPGTGKRYPFLSAVPWIIVIGFIVLIFSQNVWLTVAMAIMIAIATSNSVWQLADAKDVYPASMQGRALALCNTSMFLGIAFMQGVSGQAHNVLPFKGIDMYSSVFLMCALVLAVGTTVYMLMRRR